MTAIATFISAVALVITVFTLINDPSGRVRSDSTTAAPRQGLLRSPNLGVEFWQGDTLAVMREEKKRAGEDGERIYVELRKAPFEVGLPKLTAQTGLKVCAWVTAEHFSDPLGPDLVNDPGCLQPGMGRAAPAYSDGTLYIGQIGFNYFIDTRIAHLGDKDAFRVLQFEASKRDVDEGLLPPIYREPVPLTAQALPMYLTFAVGDTYEFVVLEFS